MVLFKLFNFYLHCALSVKDTNVIFYLLWYNKLLEKR